MKSEIITSAVAATKLGVSERRIQQLIKELNIEPQRIGKTAILSEAQVKMIANRKTTPGPAAKAKK
jgi:hypothetical protein